MNLHAPLLSLSPSLSHFNHLVAPLLARLAGWKCHVYCALGRGPRPQSSREQTPSESAKRTEVGEGEEVARGEAARWMVTDIKFHLDLSLVRKRKDKGKPNNVDTIEIISFSKKSVLLYLKLKWPNPPQCRPLLP